MGEEKRVHKAQAMEDTPTNRKSKERRVHRGQTIEAAARYQKSQIKHHMTEKYSFNQIHSNLEPQSNNICLQQVRENLKDTRMV